jgi:hypothetical protein
MAARQLTSRTRLGVIWRSRDPDCCSSTVVRGNGFLRYHQPCAPATSIQTVDAPLCRRLRLHLDHRRQRFSHTLLVQDDRRIHIKQVVPPPPKLHRPCPATALWLILVLPFNGYVDIPERFGDEGLDAVILIDDEAEGGKLAWTWVTRGISRPLETPLEPLVATHRS